ncbi:MAG: DUF2191 domain-containing protein [Anaerolinea sp.]|nr:DUF2191 domain-containing protein [Anaerolinea sp.]
MRTQITLEDDLYRVACAVAERQGTTVSEVIVQALRRQLFEPPVTARQPVELPVSSASGGLMPGVTLEPKSGLWALLDDEAV